MERRKCEGYDTTIFAERLRVPRLFDLPSLFLIWQKSSRKMLWLSCICTNLRCSAGLVVNTYSSISYDSYCVFLDHATTLAMARCLRDG